mgnify:FL=1
MKLSKIELEALLSSNQPALLLFSRGDDLRGDFSIAFKNADTEHGDIAFAQINPDEHPQLAERFNIGSKAVMIAYHNGENLARRARPWGTDVPLAVEMLQAVLPEPEVPTETVQEENNNVENQPVTVTDETFQTEVIDYDLPVIVDFWAPWCGPCKMVAPILDKLAEEYAGKIRVAKVNTDENPQLSMAFRIMSIPTIMAVKDQAVVFSQPGALPEPALRELIDKVIELEVPKEEVEPEAAN